MVVRWIISELCGLLGLMQNEKPARNKVNSGEALYVSRNTCRNASHARRSTHHHALQLVCVTPNLAPSFYFDNILKFCVLPLSTYLSRTLLLLKEKSSEVHMLCEEQQFSRVAHSSQIWVSRWHLEPTRNHLESPLASSESSRLTF